ncbi:MAG: LLM class flavin-dependent oxidoreductase [Candidatus Odinarchaeota archaeon]
MKYGLDVATGREYFNPRTLVDLAVEAEEAGWDGLFIWDCYYTSGSEEVSTVNPWVALSAIAMKTKRIKIGAMVTPLARRRPWQVARETVSLDHLSNGRLIFGAGLGFSPREFTDFGEESNLRIRGQKLDEALEVLTGLWSGERFSFQGKHYRVTDARFLPKPTQSPRIPVWTAGFWPNKKPFRRAAKWDGIYPGRADQQPFTPEDLNEVLNFVKERRKESDPFDAMIYGKTPSDPVKGAEIVEPFIEAGATWWAEGLDYERGTLEEKRERIRNGPPEP